MGTTSPKRLRRIRQSYVPKEVTRSASGRALLDRRERLVAALADQPRTVAQLARQFGLSQPTMLQHRLAWVEDAATFEAEQVPEGTEEYVA